MARELCPDEVRGAAAALAFRWGASYLGVESVWGVPTGGVVPAMLVADRLDRPVAAEPGPGVLVVDDLVDSGATAKRILDRHPEVAGFDALYRKQWSPAVASDAFDVGDSWVVFPWEQHDGVGPTDAVLRLLEWLGEDPTREGLQETPGRVTKALAELTAGYQVDPAEVLATSFDGGGYDEVVCVTDIAFTSLCEHHLLAFSGVAHVAYLPNSRVVGLSKLPRLVECFAARLQLQERLTCQIVDALDTYLHPRGSAVVVSASHSCLACRGVRKPGARMVTSRLTGLFRDRPSARAELFALIEAAQR